MKFRKCNLQDILYVPNLSYNLISVSKAVKAEKIVKFDGKYGQIKIMNGELTAIATQIGNLYYRKDCINITVPRTPQQNGVAERLNRTILDKVRSMLIDQKVPHTFWAEAIATI